MSDNRKAVRRQAWMALLLLLAGCLVAVAASRMLHVKADWTEGSVYTLSSSTRAVLTALDEPVMVKAYVTKDLPQPYGRLRRYIEDMLIAYHDAGGGRLGYEIIDPADDPNVAGALAAQNIPRVQVQAVENDQAQVKQGYLAIVIEYLNRKEVIPVVQGEEGFEYLLTRKIKKVSGKGQTTIGIVGDFGARGPAQLKRLQELAGDDDRFVEVNPATKDIPDDVQALIIAGVSQEPSAAFRYRIDQFRMQGKGILVLAGNAEPELSKGFAVAPVEAAANAWLKEDLGVAIEPGLVFDRYAARIMVNQRQGMFMMRSAVDYPFIVQTTTLDQHHDVTKDLESVTIPFASPLVGTGRADWQALAKTSELAGVQSGPPFDVDPLLPIEERFKGVLSRQSNLILAASGPADSAFAAAPAGFDAGKQLQHAAATRLIAAGAPALLDDEFLDQANTVFTLNALDWLAGDEALTALRSRGVTDRPLAELSSSARDGWKGLWMFGLPVLVALAGLLRWWRLRRREASV